MCSTPPASDDVGRAERDLARGGRDRGERAGAHAVDREAGHGLRDAREQRDVAAERQALVADLRGRGEDDVADPLRRELRVAAQQLAHDLDGHVVGARAPEHALRPGPAEGGAHAVDEARPRAAPAPPTEPSQSRMDARTHPAQSRSPARWIRSLGEEVGCA